MEFFIYGRNRPDAGAARAANQDAHWEFMEGYQDRMIARGPTLDDDGETITGSLHLVDLADESEAEAFVENDPFTMADAFEDTTVRRWTNALQRTQWDFEGDDSSPRFLFLAEGPEGDDTTEIRNGLLEDHRAYLNRPDRFKRVILRGPLWDRTGAKWVGSVLLFEAPDRGFVEDFLADEPYMRNGLYPSYEVLRWRFGGRPA